MSKILKLFYTFLLTNFLFVSLLAAQGMISGAPPNSNPQQNPPRMNPNVRPDLYPAIEGISVSVSNICGPAADETIERYSSCPLISRGDLQGVYQKCLDNIEELNRDPQCAQAMQRVQANMQTVMQRYQEELMRSSRPNMPPSMKSDSSSKNLDFLEYQINQYLQSIENLQDISNCSQSSNIVFSSLLEVSSYFAPQAAATGAIGFNLFNRLKNIMRSQQSDNDDFFKKLWSCDVNNRLKEAREQICQATYNERAASQNAESDNLQASELEQIFSILHHRHGLEQLKDQLHSRDRNIARTNIEAHTNSLRELGGCPKQLRDYCNSIRTISVNIEEQNHGMLADQVNLFITNSTGREYLTEVRGLSAEQAESVLVYFNQNSNRSIEDLVANYTTSQGISFRQDQATKLREVIDDINNNPNFYANTSSRESYCSSLSCLWMDSENSHSSIDWTHPEFGFNTLGALPSDQLNCPREPTRRERRNRHSQSAPTLNSTARLLSTYSRDDWSNDFSASCRKYNNFASALNRAKEACRDLYARGAFMVQERYRCNLNCIANPSQPSIPTTRPSTPRPATSGSR